MLNNSNRVASLTRVERGAEAPMGCMRSMLILAAATTPKALNSGKLE